MAIFSSTLMTRAKGSLGNLTIVTTKGRLIAKQKITIMSNPKSLGQTVQRKALAIAVAMWQAVGNVVKSGITSYPEYGSQYNGFVNQNIAFLKNKPIDPNALRNQDFIGVQATKGSLGTIIFTKDEVSVDGISLSFPLGALRQAARVGDSLKVVIGNPLSSEMGYFERELTADDLDISNTLVLVEGDASDYNNNSVFVAWVESADGTKSTTQKFVG